MKTRNYCLTALALLLTLSCTKDEVDTPVQNQENVVKVISDAGACEISKAISDLSAAPGSLFPDEGFKTELLHLLKSFLPKDGEVEMLIPFSYSNMEENFKLMGSLSSRIDRKLYKSGRGKSGTLNAYYKTPAGDEYDILFAKVLKEERVTIERIQTNSHVVSVTKNGSVLFSFTSYDDLYALSAFLPGNGSVLGHIHSATIQVSKATADFSFEFDKEQKHLSYKVEVSVDGDIPMATSGEPLLFIEGCFSKPEEEGPSKKMAWEQKTSLLGIITIFANSSDIAETLALVGSTFIVPKEGFPEDKCLSLSEKWEETSSIRVGLGSVEDSGNIYLGYLPVDEENPDSGFYVPCILVELYEYWGEVFTIPEFVEIFKGLIPA